ncbi:hypothetical protein AADG42_15065 [Ammonicoccus fulvus]|uniref:Adhesin domain-containing protein n=1 Tax=Ammonicoccus fulvus TaxID=3138240 RepID=A0ABZ3FUV9_9ACTN
MSGPDLTPILEELAAGRIDAAEAARRIDELKAAAPPADVPPAAADAADVTAESPSGRGADDPKVGDRNTAEPGVGETRAGETRADEPKAESKWQTYARETFSRVAGYATGEQAKQDPKPQQPKPEPTRTSPDGEDVPPADRHTTNTKGVDRVSVRAVGRRVRIASEPRVATASVDGAHVLRRTGSVLEISSDGELGASIDGFTLLRPPRSLDDVRNLGLGKELFIRVNPNLIVDVELTAGSLTTEDVRFLGKVRVTAGGAKLTGIEEAHDVLVQAGQATVKGRIATGRSRIRCESGSLVVNLDDDSNVTVRAEAQLGKVAWAGGHQGAGDEVVMGNGAARLDVGVVMGHATVRVGSEPQQEA